LLAWTGLGSSYVFTRLEEERCVVGVPVMDLSSSGVPEEVQVNLPPIPMASLPVGEYERRAEQEALPSTAAQISSPPGLAFWGSADPSQYREFNPSPAPLAASCEVHLQH
jgi:hypothetical protein